jgi:uncharacterized protein YqjF (DUF2071 family)
VSVVGFRFLRTRVLGIAIPLHTRFEEVNLRFYVRRRGDDGAWRRGVVFISEMVPRIAIALTARAMYNEPYRALPMTHRVEHHIGGATSASYEWKRDGARESVAVETHASPKPLVPGSEAEFITEHYWGYTRQRDGGTIEYRVTHPSWMVSPAVHAELRCDAASLYGAAFGELLARPPASAFLAEGSRVAVHRPVRIA